MVGRLSQTLKPAVSCEVETRFLHAMTQAHDPLPAFLDELRARTTLSRPDRALGQAHQGRARVQGLLPVPSREDAELHVNDDKGFYHCFGCGAHGDAIRFLTDARGLPFIDAVKELAAKAGMDVPAPDPRARERPSAPRR